MHQWNPASTAARLAVPVTLPFEKALPGRLEDHEILTAGGEWGKEYLLESRRLSDAGFRFVQDKGRSAATMKPWLAIRNTTTGHGVAVLLAYSGNWAIEVQPRDQGAILRVDTSPSGLQPFATFNGMFVPGALVSEFAGHWDAGAQPIVRFIRSKLLRRLGPDWPPVQYNTWYDACENFTEKQLLDAARVAAEVGCELFTVDAGWYGVGAKADWQEALGNWELNRDRLPNGLAPITEAVRQLGMKFGLWIEIECAAPSSPVVRMHPDWVLKDRGQPVSGRVALDFGNAEVRAWAKSVIDRLVTTYALGYIKMDFNTHLLVSGERLDPETDPLYLHYRGLVELWKHVRATYPELIVENCASGSLRQDAMTAALTDTHWVSDNVDNHASLAMNFGVTYLFPPEICSHWMTTPALPGGPVDSETAFTASMLGHMGLSGKIYAWDAATRKIAAERIALYKRIRARIRTADVFHLTSQVDAAAPCSMQAALYVDPERDGALLFAFQGGDPSLDHTIIPHGLAPNRTYVVRMPEQYGAERRMAGKALLEDGLSIRFPHLGASAVILIDPL